MSYYGSTDWYQKVAAGDVAGHSLVHKFGHGEVGTTYAPISESGFYRTPTTVTALEVVSTSTEDGVGGAGARVITVTGIGAGWTEVSQDVTMNGLTPVPLATSLYRINRWFVKETGTYATQSVGSHVGTITIREASVGPTWSILSPTEFAFGQSFIGAYTIPSGKKAYLLHYNINVDTNKAIDVAMFRRDNADDISAPYTGVMRVLGYHVGLLRDYNHKPISPQDGLVGPCDIGFMAKVATGTAQLSVDFELLLVDVA